MIVRAGVMPIQVFMESPFKISSTIDTLEQMKISNPSYTSFSTTKPVIAQAIIPTANIHIDKCVIHLIHFDLDLCLSFIN